MKIDLSLLEYSGLEKFVEVTRWKIGRQFAEHPDLKEPEIPQEFYCPITGDVMNEPMKDKYGHVYEKSAIIEWLDSHENSPLNRQPLTLGDLRPDTQLKRRIDEFFLKANCA